MHLLRLGTSPWWLHFISHMTFDFFFLSSWHITVSNLCPCREFSRVRIYCHREKGIIRSFKDSLEKCKATYPSLQSLMESIFETFIEQEDHLRSIFDEQRNFWFAKMIYLLISQCKFPLGYKNPMALNISKFIKPRDTWVHCWISFLFVYALVLSTALKGLATGSQRRKVCLYLSLYS